MFNEDAELDHSYIEPIRHFPIATYWLYSYICFHSKSISHGKLIF